MPDTWYHYGYDGSGVPLSCRVELRGMTERTATIVVPERMIPYVTDRVGGIVPRADGVTIVRRDRVWTDQAPRLASFNFLD